MKKSLPLLLLSLLFLLTGCGSNLANEKLNVAENNQSTINDIASTTGKNSTTTIVNKSGIGSTTTAPKNIVTKPAVIIGDPNKGCGEQNGDCCFGRKYCQGQKIDAMFGEQCGCCVGSCTYWQKEGTCDAECQKNILRDAIEEGMLSNISLCNYITGTVKYGPSDNNAGDCYGFMIYNSLKDDISYCEKVPIKSQIKDCYHIVAVYSDKENLCAIFPQEYKDDCLASRTPYGKN